MKLPPATQVLHVPGEGTMLAREGLRSELIARLIQTHRETRDPERILKRNRGTLVTRVRVDLAAHDREHAAWTEVVVKEVPIPWRRRFHYRLGGRSPFVRELEVCHRLASMGLETARPLACSLRPAGRTEILIAEHLAGCVPLRDLLWLGDGVIREPQELRALLARVGGWLRKVHDAGVWQRDMKPSNILVRRGRAGFDSAALFLIDVTAVRLYPGGLDRGRRVRNLTQLLDLTPDLDGEPRQILVEAYLGAAAPPELERWTREVAAGIEARRDARQRRSGYRLVDEEHRYVPK